MKLLFLLSLDLFGIATFAYGQYQSYNGSDNNLANPSWGKAGGVLGRRIVSSGFADNISLPFAGVTNTPFPSSFEIADDLFGNSGIKLKRTSPYQWSAFSTYMMEVMLSTIAKELITTMHFYLF
jgi:hypothetical protein